VTAPYPVPAATEEPLGSVTRVLALSGTTGDGNGYDGSNECTDGSSPADSQELFSGDSLPQLSGRIYGGQVVAQGLLAGAATLDADGAGSTGERLPHSVHAYFIRGGKPDKPVSFAVDRLRDGRSFSQRRTTASQDGVPILTMISSFQEAQGGADEQVEAPEVPRPEELTSALEIFRTINHPVAKFLGRTAAFDLRHVEGNIYLTPGRERTGVQHLWARSRGRLPAEASQTVHRALLTYMCDQIMLEPALRSQGLCWRSEGMSLATLDHTQWFHRDIDVCDWMLFVQDSPSSQGGRAMVRAEVFDSSGRLVSSIAQEGMIRMPMQGTRGSGQWEVRLED
jgi:possible choloyl-coA hydrolase